VWDVDHPNELAYEFGGSALRRLVAGGLPVDLHES